MTFKTLHSLPVWMESLISNHTCMQV